MKRIWYFYLKLSVYITALVYFRRVERNGLENIPDSGPVLLGVRHSNALMDPLMSGVFVARTLHFLVRADVFRNPMVRKIWASLNMMPIYRLRDGRQTMGQNAEIFDRCHQLLRKGNCLEIFPEGGHSALYKLEPLKKGTARIALGALDGMTRENDVQIVPVGLNYSSDKAFRGHLSVNYGTPISTRAYFDPADPLSPLKVRDLTLELQENLRLQVIDLRPPAPYLEMNALRMALEIHENGIVLPDFALSKRISERLVQACEDEVKRGKLLEWQAEHATLREKTGLREAGLLATPVRLRQLLRIWAVKFPLLLCLPLGMLLHAPMLIPASRAPRLIKDPMFFAALRFISGMFLGQLLYLSYFMLSWIVLGSLWVALAAVGGSLLVGVGAVHGYDAWMDMRRLARIQKVENAFPEESRRMRDLQSRQSALLAEK